MNRNVQFCGKSPGSQNKCYFHQLQHQIKPKDSLVAFPHRKGAQMMKENFRAL